MEPNQDAIQIFLKDQLKKLEELRSHHKKNADGHLPVITICMEAGSGGSLVAQRTAERLGFDFFHRQIIQEIAESGKISPNVLEAIEKERLSGIQDFIQSLLDNRYLWPGVYLDHLHKVVLAIGKRGGSVIVGRGANFILPSAKTLSVRVVAPLDVRIQNVARVFKLSESDAKKRILNRDSKRSAFIRKSFDVEAADADHYDIIVNTGRLSIEAAVETICMLWCSRRLRSETI